MPTTEESIEFGFSFETNWETFVFWPSLALLRSIGVCECADCTAAGREPEPQAFGWCLNLSFLWWTVYYSWEDRG